MGFSYIWHIIQTAALHLSTAPIPVLSYLFCSRYCKVFESLRTDIKIPKACPLAEFPLNLLMFILIDTHILKLFLGLCQLLSQDFGAQDPW